MAPKSILFLLAFVLVVTRMGSSVEEVNNVETELAKAPVHACAPKAAPVYAPAKAPVYAPKTAPVPAPPVYPPKMAPVPAPPKAPVYPPKTAPVPAPPVYPPKTAPVPAPPVYPPKMAPVQAPAKSPVYYPPIPVVPKACVGKCMKYCKPVTPKRPCQRMCSVCCGKFQCVPGIDKCNKWDKVEIRGYAVKCP